MLWFHDICLTMALIADGIEFVVKNCAAEEFPMVTGPGMRTLGDLRAEIELRFRIPRFLLHLVARGKNLDKYSDGHSLEVALGGTGDEVEGQDRYIWLLWLRDTDFISVRRGGFFLGSQLEAKRIRFEAEEGIPFSYVTLGDWKTLCRRCIGLYQRFLAAQDDDFYVDLDWA